MNYPGNTMALKRFIKKEGPEITEGRVVTAEWPPSAMEGPSALPGSSLNALRSESPSPSDK